MRDIIDEIIEREGGSIETNDPADSGGRTRWGISERANPEAWADGQVTYPEAREIYGRKYIGAERFELIPNDDLREQVIDYGVMSGPDTSARLLQEVVGAKVDGALGLETLRKIAEYPAGTLFGYPVPGFVMLNLEFERARAARHTRLALTRTKDLRFLFGWLRRTVSFR